ncbi:MAG: hypothetical protein J5501_09900 [Ruminococcus sp.]|nr:hypothetical protein [Ruminococcus sp.]
MADVLRTASGFKKGYDKTAVLALVDRLNTVKAQYEKNAISRDEALAQLIDLRNYTELPLRRGGFVEEDVENYISSIIDGI